MKRLNNEGYSKKIYELFSEILKREYTYTQKGLNISGSHINPLSK
jgi:hypothetical protein